MTRREMGLALPWLAASAQGAPRPTLLAAAVYPYESLPVKKNGANASRQVLDGLSHTGFHIDLHETELAPGAAPHDAHSHAHEEIVLIREGTLEFTIAGKATQAGPGSVTYMASNIHHGLRNAGTTTARYFVIALGRALAT